MNFWGLRGILALALGLSLAVPVAASAATTVTSGGPDRGLLIVGNAAPNSLKINYRIPTGEFVVIDTRQTIVLDARPSTTGSCTLETPHRAACTANGLTAGTGKGNDSVRVCLRGRPAPIEDSLIYRLGAGHDSFKDACGPYGEFVLGGKGNDDLQLGPGDDTALASDGNDRVNGGPGNDDVQGDDNKADRGRDYLVGGPGKDFLFGGGGIDVILGGGGGDNIDSSQNADKVNGGDGQDWVIRATSRDDRLRNIERRVTRAEMRQRY